MANKPYHSATVGICMLVLAAGSLVIGGCGDPSHPAPIGIAMALVSAGLGILSFFRVTILVPIVATLIFVSGILTLLLSEYGLVTAWAAIVPSAAAYFASIERHLEGQVRAPNLAGRLLPPIIVMIVVVGLLEVALRVAHVKPYMMALPSDVLRSIVRDRADLAAGLGWTALAALGGFVASGLIGVLAAVALASSPLVRWAVYPYTIFFQTVPIVAVAPMLLFWLGAGLLPVIACAFIVSVFPVIANTLAGLLSTDPALVDLFRLYGARKLSAMWKLRLPSALPNIFTGLRVAAGLAVIGTIVAEFLVGQIVGNVGLGVLVITGFKDGKLAVAFAAVLLASLLGLAMFAAVNLANWLALRKWNASEA